MSKIEELAEKLSSLPENDTPAVNHRARRMHEEIRWLVTDVIEIINNIHATSLNEEDRQKRLREVYKKFGIYNHD